MILYLDQLFGSNSRQSLIRSHVTRPPRQSPKPWVSVRDLTKSLKKKLSPFFTVIFPLTLPCSFFSNWCSFFFPVQWPVDPMETEVPHSVASWTNPTLFAELSEAPIVFSQERNKKTVHRAMDRTRERERERERGRGEWSCQCIKRQRSDGVIKSAAKPIPEGINERWGICWWRLAGVKNSFARGSDVFLPSIRYHRSDRRQSIANVANMGQAWFTCPFPENRGGLSYGEHEKKRKNCQEG